MSFAKINNNKIDNLIFSTGRSGECAQDGRENVHFIFTWFPQIFSAFLISP